MLGLFDGLNLTETLQMSYDINLPEWVYTRGYVLWGVVPYIAVNIGFWSTVILLETVVALETGTPIEYKGGYHVGDKPFSSTSRWDALKKVRAEIPFLKQLRGALWNTAGPMAILNSVLSAFVLPFFIDSMPVDASKLTLSISTVNKIVLLFILQDFFLYWGHRIQHEFKYLWETRHYLHHKIGTPSPVSTIYIHPDDATLQAGIPMMIAALIAKPHPLIFAIFIALRVSENAVNHCGLDSLLVNVVTLKVLPFRAGVKHHDAHHHFSNYAGNAKNYGESFWIWDWLFGTLSNTKVGLHHKGNADMLSRKPIKRVIQKKKKCNFKTKKQ